jgi:hypothetical protein
MQEAKGYSKDYVERCRADMIRQLSAYRKFGESDQKSEAKAFEGEFYNTMLLALDQYFAQRKRAVEGRATNPLTEVRILASSVLEHDGVLTEDESIDYDPDESLTGTLYGETIDLDGAKFARLAAAYFEEVEKKYPEPTGAKEKTALLDPEGFSPDFDS